VKEKPPRNTEKSHSATGLLQFPCTTVVPTLFPEVLVSIAPSLLIILPTGEKRKQGMPFLLNILNNF
jgi:hypothetical protein